MMPSGHPVDPVGDSPTDGRPSPEDGLAVDDAKPRPRRALLALDTGIVVGLAVAAFLLRRHLPTDGLFYDDAWQALAAREATVGNLVTLGLGQPGWLLELVAWSRLAGSEPRTFVIPALVAGCLGPPALYLTLRRLRVPRVIALLLGTMLVVSTTHIIYSTRVKSYTTDVLVVLGLSLLVDRMVGRRWGPRTAVAWFVGASMLALFSTAALLAAAGAGAIFVLERRGDAPYRLAAVGGQAVASAATVLVTSRTYDQTAVADFFGRKGGYIDLSSDVVGMARQVVSRLTNVVDVFPGGPEGWLVVGVLAIGTGLLVAAWRGPNQVVARFLLTLVVIALMGAVTNALPFGPPARPKIRGLGRVTLWLVPALALGLAAFLERARRTAPGQWGRRAFDGLVLVAAAVLLVTAVGDGNPAVGGSQAASEEAVAELGPGDVIWLTRVTTYSFAIATDLPLEIRPTPERAIGFLPELDDPRIHPTDFQSTAEELSRTLVGADRVLLVNGQVPPLGYSATYLAQLRDVLRGNGFDQESTRMIEGASIATWVR